MITISYDVAMSCGKDAANRHMKKNGRKTWNEDDYNVMVDTFNRLWPIERDYERAV